MNYAAGYNQIQMALEDQDAIVFCIPKGIFGYKVIFLFLKIWEQPIKGQCKRFLKTSIG